MRRKAVGKLCDWSAFQLRFGLIAVHQIEGAQYAARWRVVVKVDLLKGATGLFGHQLASLSHGRAAGTPLGAIRFGTPGFSQCDSSQVVRCTGAASTLVPSVFESSMGLFTVRG